MQSQSFTITLSIDQTPKEAFNAIKNVRGWWSEEIEGNTNKLNDEFKYHFEDIHRCEMKLIEVIPEKKVAWLVMDNYFKPGIFDNTSKLRTDEEMKRKNSKPEIFDDSSHLSYSNDKFTNNKPEWVGTKIIFEIVEKDGKTLILLTHLGLVREYECFDICAKGWNYYISQSLLSLITTGKGMPNSTGKPMTATEEKIISASNH